MYACFIEDWQIIPPQMIKCLTPLFWFYTPPNKMRKMTTNIYKQTYKRKMIILNLSRRNSRSYCFRPRPPIKRMRSFIIWMTSSTFIDSAISARGSYCWEENHFTIKPLIIMHKYAIWCTKLQPGTLNSWAVHHAHTLIHTPLHIHTHAHTLIHIHMNTYKHTCTLACVCMRVHTHTHTHTHICIRLTADRVIQWPDLNPEKYLIKIRTRKKFLAGGKACVAIFQPTPGLKGRALISSGLSREGTLISASAVLRCRNCNRQKRSKSMYFFSNAPLILYLISEFHQ